MGVSLSAKWKATHIKWGIWELLFINNFGIILVHGCKTFSVSSDVKFSLAHIYIDMIFRRLKNKE